MKTFDVAIDVAEVVIVGTFAALNWNSSTSLFEVNSQPYWIVFGLTVAFLLLLLTKLIRKYVINNK